MRNRTRIRTRNKSKTKNRSNRKSKKMKGGASEPEEMSLTPNPMINNPGQFNFIMSNQHETGIYTSKEGKTSEYIYIEPVDKPSIIKIDIMLISPALDIALNLPPFLSKDVDVDYISYNTNNTLLSRTRHIEKTCITIKKSLFQITNKIMHIGGIPLPGTFNRS